MEIQRSSSPLHTEPALTHPLQTSPEIAPRKKDPGPDLSKTRPVVLSPETSSVKCALERFENSSDLQTSVPISEEFFEVESEEDRKTRELKVKKEALLSKNLKQMANYLLDFQVSHLQFAKTTESSKELPTIGAYLKACPAFNDFNQKIYQILTSETTLASKLTRLEDHYSKNNVAEMFQFINRHLANLDGHFGQDDFISKLKLHIFKHGHFLDTIDAYAGHKGGDLIAHNFQSAFEALPSDFNNHCCSFYKQSLEVAAPKLAEFLQLNPEETISYEQARTTLVAHYGRRIVDEVELSFPAQCTEPKIKASLLRELLVNIALRVKKEDLVELYNAIQGEGSDELFACARNIPENVIRKIKESTDFNQLDFEQLDGLVSAFRSYKKQGNVKPINDDLTKNILVSPITTDALYFLKKSNEAHKYVQPDEDAEDYTHKADYAPREHLAREMAYALRFEGTTGVILKTLSQNKVSYAQVVGTFSEKGLHAHMLCPLTEDPKGTTGTLLFRGIKPHDFASIKRAFGEGWEAGAKTFSLLQNELWDWFKSCLPNSPFLEIDIVGHSQGARDAAMFADCFVQKITPPKAQPTSSQPALANRASVGEPKEQRTNTPKEKKTNLANIKLVQTWGFNSPASTLQTCSDYNYHRLQLQDSGIVQPVIAHNYILVEGDLAQNSNWALHGWVHPKLESMKHGQDPKIVRTYTNKNGVENSVPDTRLVIVTPTSNVSSVSTTIHSHGFKWAKTLDGKPSAAESKVIDPADINDKLGTLTFWEAGRNFLGSTLEHNILRNNGNAAKYIYDSREAIAQTTVDFAQTALGVARETTNTVISVAYSAFNSAHAYYSSSSQASSSNPASTSDADLSDDWFFLPKPKVSSKTKAKTAE